MRNKFEQWELIHQPGWRKLYEPLLLELNNLDGRLLDIKEKFGGLRFYYTFDQKDVDEHTKMLRYKFSEQVNKAEILSERTCEKCGEHAEKTSDRGRVSTLCPNCK